MAGNNNNARIWQDAVAATKQCPPLEVLEKVIEQSSSEPEAAAHVAGCTHCQTEMAMLKSFESSVPSENEGAAVAWIAAQLERNQKAPAAKATSKVVPFWRSLFRVPYMAAAAALIAAISLGISLYHTEDGKPKLGVPNVGVYRNIETIQLETTGDLSQPPDQLTWAAVPGASSYVVEVDDVTGDKLWESRAAQNSITVDSQLKALLRPGKPLTLRVTALDATGKELATGKGQFRVVAK
jgi:hypothetical protein